MQPNWLGIPPSSWYHRDLQRQIQIVDLYYRRSVSIHLYGRKLKGVDQLWRGSILCLMRGAHRGEHPLVRRSSKDQ